MIRRPPRSTPLYSSAASDVYKRQTLVWERDTGILKKLLVAPASRYAIVIGRSMSSGVRAIIQVIIVIPVALLLGVRFIPNPAYFVAALVILFVISGGFAALSIIVASLLKTRERFMGIGQALIPVSYTHL